MKYIHKDTTSLVVHACNQELSSQGLDKQTLLTRQQAGENLNGTKLYEKVRALPGFRKLRNLLNQEQGGVCCYCGLNLNYTKGLVRFSVEHIKPKKTHPESVGDYENLLLSCHLTNKENMDLTRKERNNSLHCDQYKEDKELYHTPLDTDCADFFEYNLDGTVSGTDAKATTDIQTLNLNCQSLIEKRRAAIEPLLFPTTGESLSNEDYLTIANNIGNRDNDGNHREFYFVIQSVIAKLLHTNI